MPAPASPARTVLASIALATCGGALASLVAVCLVTREPSRRLLDVAVAFAAGVLLCAACLHLIPEALEAPGFNPHLMGITLMAGLLAFFVLERIALWRHAHSVVPVAPAVIVLGDGVHNFVDGVLIAAAFLTDPALGWGTATAVLAHELPQELGDYLLLRAAGLSRARSVLLNILSSLGAVLGGLAGYAALSSAQAAVPYALTLAAASFLYMAVSDLMPALRLHREVRLSTLQALAGTAGIVVIAAGGHLAY